MCELRAAVQEHLPENELRLFVDNCLVHYDEVLNLKMMVAKSDVFHLVSGMWKTPAERCFLWMGDFRPSELLKVPFHYYLFGFSFLIFFLHQKETNIIISTIIIIIIISIIIIIITTLLLFNMGIFLKIYFSGREIIRHGWNVVTSNSIVLDILLLVTLFLPCRIISRP